MLFETYWDLKSGVGHEYTEIATREIETF